MLRQLLWAFLILLPCCGRPAAHDPSALIQPLIDPAKLATLSERGANPRVQKATAILWRAKQDGHDPAIYEWVKDIPSHAFFWSEDHPTMLGGPGEG